MRIENQWQKKLSYLKDSSAICYIEFCLYNYSQKFKNKAFFELKVVIYLQHKTKKGNTTYGIQLRTKII